MNLPTDETGTFSCARWSFVSLLLKCLYLLCLVLVVVPCLCSQYLCVDVSASSHLSHVFSTISSHNSNLLIFLLYESFLVS